MAGHPVYAPVATLTHSTVSFGVTGQGSTIGGDYVGIDNTGGVNTITVDGPSDVIYANDDATNVITTGPTAGYTYLYMDSPEIGSPENVGTGYNSTITLGGNGNYLFGSDANHTVMIGGVVDGITYGNNDDVTLGNGNNTIRVTGTANQIEVGSGSNIIDAGSGNAMVALEFFGTGTGFTTADLKFS